MTPTGMRIWDGTLLRSSKGDMLDDLNKQLHSAMERRELARQQLQDASQAVRPFIENWMKTELEQRNLEYRLNIWWAEYRMGKSKQEAGL